MKKFKVTVIDLYRIRWKASNVKFIKADILNYKKLEKIIKGHDIVYNFAAVADIGESYLKPMSTIKVNILGNAYLLNLCVKNKIKRYVFASSIYVYSQQGGFYRASKQSSEILIDEYQKVYKLPFTILRYGSIYGPRSDERNGLYKIVLDSIKRKKLIYRGSSKAVRSYIHVRDAAKLSVKILKKKYENKYLLVRGKKNYKIGSLLQTLGKLIKNKSKPRYLNQTQKGHYDSTPFSQKKILTKILYPKNAVSLKFGLEELRRIILKN